MDIVTLFNASTDKYMSRFASENEFTNDNKPDMWVHVEWRHSEGIASIHTVYPRQKKNVVIPVTI